MRMLRDTRVADKLDSGRSTVWYRLKTDADFPRPVKIHGQTLWLESEIDEYIRRKVAQTRGEKVPA